MVNGDEPLLVVDEEDRLDRGEALVGIQALGDVSGIVAGRQHLAHDSRIGSAWARAFMLRG
jgi:hypothetical protein